MKQYLYTGNISVKNLNCIPSFYKNVFFCFTPGISAQSNLSLQQQLHVHRLQQKRAAFGVKHASFSHGQQAAAGQGSAHLFQQFQQMSLDPSQQPGPPAQPVANQQVGSLPHPTPQQQQHSLPAAVPGPLQQQISGPLQQTAHIAQPQNQVPGPIQQQTAVQGPQHQQILQPISGQPDLVYVQNPPIAATTVDLLVPHSQQFLLLQSQPFIAVATPTQVQGGHVVTGGDVLQMSTPDLHKTQSLTSQGGQSHLAIVNQTLLDQPGLSHGVQAPPGGLPFHAAQHPTQHPIVAPITANPQAHPHAGLPPHAPHSLSSQGHHSNLAMMRRKVLRQPGFKQGGPEYLQDPSISGGPPGGLTTMLEHVHEEGHEDSESDSENEAAQSHGLSQTKDQSGSALHQQDGDHILETPPNSPTNGHMDVS